MARKRQKVSTRLMFFWLITAGMILMLSPKKFTGQLQLAFARTFHWPLTVSRDLMLSATTKKQPQEKPDFSEEQLKNAIANLQAQLQKERKKNALTEQFVKEHSLFDAILVDADITQISDNELIIIPEQKEGLKIGLFVLGDNSIIGTISEVLANSAKVRLINNPQSQIAVKINNKDAVIQGNNKNQIKMPLLSTKTRSIKVGDEVFCRPKPGFLNTPVIIARVEECKIDLQNPLMWDVILQPACSIETLTNVSVIIPNTSQTGK